MKRLTAAVLCLVMMLSFAACSKSYTDAELEQKVEAGEFGTLYGHYSVKNYEYNKNDDKFYVQFDQSQEGLDYYDKDGTLILFDGDPVVYNPDGSEYDISKLRIGQDLLITYDCKIYGKNPATIKAIKIVVQD